MHWIVRCFIFYITWNTSAMFSHVFQQVWERMFCTGNPVLNTCSPY